MRFTRWDQKASTEVTNAITKSLSLVHTSRISDEAMRERIAGYLACDSFLALCDLDPTYATCTVGDAINVRQVNAFYKKRVDLDIGVNRQQVAWGKFEEAEALCAQTNDIERMIAEGLFQRLPHVEARLFRAQQKIAKILGDVPSLESLQPYFGPGATTQIPKRNASARRKLSQTYACSEELVPLVKECIELLPTMLPDPGPTDFVVWGPYSSLALKAEEDGWEITWPDSDSSPTVVTLSEGNEWSHVIWGEYPYLPDNVGIEKYSVPVEIHTGKLAFVPKSAKTDRSVVVEPWLNSFYQLGLGKVMAGRLRTHGVDIRDQTRNQNLARQGSLSGDLATLDLSSASDTIATGFVWSLLPIEWAFLLSHFRTGEVTYEGRSLRLQKFSSMGNGFTFPLETLIFYAMACACVEPEDEEKVSVYGDDIIVPTYAYPVLCEVLNAGGFIPNTDKSFADGPFRESCGADYLSGIDIRPSYLKDALHAYDLFRLHNFYVRHNDQECADICLSYIDSSLQKWGPDGYGDGHLHWHRDDDRVGVAYKRDLGWAGYIFETYSFKGRRDFNPLPGDRILPAYCIYAAYGDDEERALKTRERPVEWSVVRTAKELLRTAALLFNPRERATQYYDKQGALGVSIPGVKGYKSIKIYTL